jgi:predicted nucleotide-binding protein with TIR-like domain
VDTSFRPRLFIGSSSEGLPVAEQLQLRLERDSEVQVWDQGVFGISVVILDRLLAVARRVDFAALCLTPDDVTDKRGTLRHSPRDNVIFEAGLFMGRLGRSRTFLVYEKESELELPSDLLGLTGATYRSGELESSVASAATRIRAAMAKFRPRELFSTTGRCERRDFDDEWRDGARGRFDVEGDHDEAVLAIQRDNAAGDVVVYLTSYRDGGSRAPAISAERVEMGQREVRVELDVQASADCTFLIQLKALDAPGGQYVGEKRVRLDAGGSRTVRASFAITTIADFRVRLQQRSVSNAPSRLEVRRLAVTEAIVLDQRA